MTVSSETSRVTYTADGTVGPYSVPFYFLANADLVVKVWSGSAETTKTLTTHYTVSGAGNSAGGSITFTSVGNAPANGDTLVIYRDPAVTQTFDPSDGGSLSSSSLERAFDKIVMQVQRLSSRLSRTVKLRETSTLTDLELPEPTPNGLLAWNEDADGFDTKAIDVDVQGYSAHLAALAAADKTDGGFVVANGTTYTVETGATARASMGVTIGEHVQAYNAGLADIAGLDKDDGNIIVGDGDNWVAESGATARASLGLTIGQHVQGQNARLQSIVDLELEEEDLLVGDGATAFKRLPKGSNGQILVVGANGSLSWDSVDGTGDMRRDMYDPQGIDAELVSTGAQTLNDGQKAQAGENLSALLYGISQTLAEADKRQAWANIDVAGYLHLGNPENYAGTDTQKVQAALDAIKTAGKGVLYLPRVYTITAKLTITLAALEFLTIRGNDITTSGLLVDNEDGGIQITGTARNCSVHCYDFHIAPGREVAGTGFQFTVSPGGVQSRRIFEMQNVFVGPIDQNTKNTFNKFIVATGMFRVFMQNVFCWEGFYAEHKGEVICDISDTYSPRMAWCMFLARSLVGVKHVSGDTEGGEFFQIVSNRPDIGLHCANSAGREPHYNIVESHFNCIKQGVIIDGVKYLWLRDNLFYSNNGPEIGGLTDGATYYVVNATANTFQLSATSGGAPVNISRLGWENGHSIGGLTFNGSNRNIVGIDESRFTINGHGLTNGSAVVYSAPVRTYNHVELRDCTHFYILHNGYRGGGSTTKHNLRHVYMAPSLSANSGAAVKHGWIDDRGGFYENTAAVPYYFGSGVEDVEITLPQRLANFDFVSYPSSLIHIAVGATGIRWGRSAQMREVAGGVLEVHPTIDGSDANASLKIGKGVAVGNGAAVPDTDGYLNVQTGIQLAGAVVIDPHGALRPAYSTSAELQNAGSAANGSSKRKGTYRFDSTLNRPVWAQGPQATAPWVDGLGNVVHTPA